MKIAALFAVCFSFLFADGIEKLPLDVIAYEDFARRDPHAIAALKRALHEKGIAGIRGIPGYREKVERFIEAARGFSMLPEEAKARYAPDRSRGETFLGYEKGKEKFQRPDGKWVVDDSKISYYAFVPDTPSNKWPLEVDVRGPYEAIGGLMSEMGAAVMREMGLVGEMTGIDISSTPRVGRMLHYKKAEEGTGDNPLWCGAHFDHSLFTALLPSCYFVGGMQITEPAEAGLFVRSSKECGFQKVVADDPDVMLFQVGEFGQLATNDAIRATEHRVHKAVGAVERYTMALFFDAPMDVVIHSTSLLTEDARYGGPAGSPCSYQRWNDESFKRYLVKEPAIN